MPPLEPALDAAVERHWQAALAARPLFNGLVFSVDRVAPDLLEGHWTEFRRCVAQFREPGLDLRVRPLAVCGALRCADGVVFGRRETCAIYQAGRWQLPPAGSVDTSEGLDLNAHLLRELREELGIAADEPPVPICLVEHPGNRVLELGFSLRTRLSGSEVIAAHAACGDLEYERLMVVPDADVPARLAAMGDAVTPPAWALLGLC